MFENSLIYRVGADKAVDLGLLAETMFFYRSTNLLLESGSVLALAKMLPRDVLLELFDRDILKLSYMRPRFAVVTSGLVHNVGAFTFSGSKDKRVYDHQEEIVETLERDLGNSRETRKLARSIADRVSPQRFRGVPEKEKIVADLIRADFEDNQFVQRAVAIALSHLVPDFPLPPDFRFQLIKFKEGEYIADTNLDFDAVNKVYRRVVPPEHSTITSAWLLCQLVDARVDAFFAGYYMAEPVTVPLSSDLMQIKYFDFLRRRNNNERDIELFHEIVVPGFPTIRETINSGERSIAEFLKLLDQASKFKKWLSEANPDVGLIQSYYKDATKGSWAEHLGGKLIRFVLATGAGFGAAAALGPAGGLGVSAADNFLLDRILKGWRPNTFVEGPYRKFATGRP